ncbi:MAG TPA: MFS transporter, partial [Chloroflexia bacterium]|nr:MFS transporter [Chloroflexia bacterium]
MLANWARPRIHYAWIIAGVTFLTLIAAAGMRSTPGVIIVPLQHEFGWSLADISLAVSINLLLFGLCGPFAAAFMDRFGMRRVMIAALVMVACAAAATTLMRELWQLYLLWGGLVGLATGSMASVLAAMVANRWFVERRGVVTGVLTAAGATGQLIFLPLLATLTVNINWRAASFTTAGAAVLVAVVVALVMRDRPRDVGLQPYGAAPDAPDAVASVANPVTAALGGLARGLRSRNFWLLGGSFFI